MKTYDVYILECKDNLVCTGVPNGIARRFDEHRLGINKTGFTYKRRPVRFIGHETFNDMEQAIAIAKQLKKWRSIKKRALANGDEELLHILAECRNVSHFKYKP